MVPATQGPEVVPIAVRAVQAMLAPEAAATLGPAAAPTTAQAAQPMRARAAQPTRARAGRSIRVLAARHMMVPAGQVTKVPVVHVTRVLEGPAIQAPEAAQIAPASAIKGRLARRGIAPFTTSSHKKRPIAA